VNLQTIRDMVRTQLDLDETDLPDVLLDQYVRDGYQRMMNLETRWPSFEMLWAIPAVANTPAVLQPDDALEIDSVMGADGYPLQRVDRRWAEGMFNLVSPTMGTPRFWFRLGIQLYLLPVPSIDQPLSLYGWRRPLDWVSLGASAQVDADERLHLPIVWYACSTGYAQQEDEVLEATYMNRFKESSALARDSVMKSWTGQPKAFASIPYRTAGVTTGRPQLILKPPDIVQEPTSIIGGTP
jgi:hypothetical protein